MHGPGKIEQTDLVVDAMQDGGRHVDAGEIAAQIRIAQFNRTLDGGMSRCCQTHAEVPDLELRTQFIGSVEEVLAEGLEHDRADRISSGNQAIYDLLAQSIRERFSLGQLA